MKTEQMKLIHHIAKPILTEIKYSTRIALIMTVIRKSTEKSITEKFLFHSYFIKVHGNLFTDRCKDFIELMGILKRKTSGEMIQAQPINSRLTN